MHTVMRSPTKKTLKENCREINPIVKPTITPCGAEGERVSSIKRKSVRQ